MSPHSLLTEPLSCILSSCAPTSEPVLKRAVTPDLGTWDEHSPEPDYLPEEVNSPVMNRSANFMPPDASSDFSSADSDSSSGGVEPESAGLRLVPSQMTASDYHNLCYSVFRSITFCPAPAMTVDLRKVTCSQKYLFFTFDIHADHLFMLPEGCYTIPEEC